MKVRDLKKLLDAVDENFDVVLSKDAEGNRYSALAEVSKEVTKVANYGYRDIFSTGKANSIVLWPVN